MRIEAYTQVQNVYQAQKARQTQKTNTVSRPSDQFSISSIGRDMQTAKAAVANSADIREDITAPIKAQIQSGTYSVSNESFAEKLLAKYQESLV